MIVDVCTKLGAKRGSDEVGIGVIVVDEVGLGVTADVCTKLGAKKGSDEVGLGVIVVGEAGLGVGVEGDELASDRPGGGDEGRGRIFSFAVNEHDGERVLDLGNVDEEVLVGCPAPAGQKRTGTARTGTKPNTAAPIGRCHLRAFDFVCRPFLLQSLKPTQPGLGRQTDVIAATSG